MRMNTTEASSDYSSACAKAVSIRMKKALAGCLCLRQFPRMLICIRLVVVNDDGALLAVALNACVMALLDAALPMNYVPNASIFCLSKECEMLLDPTHAEEDKALATLLFIINPSAAAESAVIFSEFTIKPSPAGENTQNVLSSPPWWAGDVLGKNIIMNAVNNAVQTSQAINLQIRQIMQERLNSKDTEGGQLRITGK